MKPLPDLRVADWLDSQLSDIFRITTVVLAELLNGIEVLPDGKRKQGLHEALNDIVAEMIEGRVLAFDMSAAG